MPQENRINLSIVIPVYNEAQYISKLLQELKTYFNSSDIEVIIIDDGSIDQSLLKVNEFKDNVEF